MAIAPELPAAHIPPEQRLKLHRAAWPLVHTLGLDYQATAAALGTEPEIVASVLTEMPTPPGTALTEAQEKRLAEAAHELLSLSVEEKATAVGVDLAYLHKLLRRYPRTHEIAKRARQIASTPNRKKLFELVHRNGMKVGAACEQLGISRKNGTRWLREMGAPVCAPAIRGQARKEMTAMVVFMFTTYQWTKGKIASELGLTCHQVIAMLEEADVRKYRLSKRGTEEGANGPAGTRRGRRDQ
ncbi:transposase [Crossiella equi]|uniref:Transposase n=1 Tax=Crossiella equi TaxID=130796 RepID=A0ABS5AM11_9PSEU|nr:hypothetical protein [Crossiella equi]MBP2477604.1 transposase [Crossiella equi]